MKIIENKNNKMVIELENGSTVRIDNNRVKISSKSYRKTQVSSVDTSIEDSGDIEHVNLHTNLKAVSKKKYSRSDITGKYSATRIYEKGERIYNSICTIFSK